MRTRLLTLSLLIVSWLFATSVLAQKRIPREVHIGAIGGANASQYDFYPSLSQKWTPSYTGGVAIRYIEETLFGLQTEFLITRRMMVDDYEAHPEWSFQRSFTYLEVPIMAHIYFKAGERHEVAVDMGPKIGWFLWDDVEDGMPADFGQPGSETSTYTTAHHRLDVTKKFDYGIQAGLGYEYKFNKDLSMQIQGRYYYGLGNMWPETKADDFQQSSNQSIQLVLSFWWHYTIKGKRIKK